MRHHLPLDIFWGLRIVPTISAPQSLLQLSFFAKSKIDLRSNRLRPRRPIQPWLTLPMIQRGHRSSCWWQRQSKGWVQWLFPIVSGLWVAGEGSSIASGAVILCRDLVDVNNQSSGFDGLIKRIQMLRLRSWGGDVPSAWMLEVPFKAAFTRGPNVSIPQGFCSHQGFTMAFCLIITTF